MGTGPSHGILRARTDGVEIGGGRRVHVDCPEYEHIVGTELLGAQVGNHLRLASLHFDGERSCPSPENGHGQLLEVRCSAPEKSDVMVGARQGEGRCATRGGVRVGNNGDPSTIREPRP
jgi:hypothetical protein